MSYKPTTIPNTPPKQLTESQKAKRARRIAKRKAAKLTNVKVEKKQMDVGMMGTDNKKLLIQRVQEPGIADMIENLLSPAYPMEEHYHGDWDMGARVIIVLPTANTQRFTNHWKEAEKRQEDFGDRIKMLRLIEHGMQYDNRGEATHMYMKRVGDFEVFKNIIQIPVLLKGKPSLRAAKSFGGFIFDDFYPLYLHLHYLDRKEVGTVVYASKGRVRMGWPIINTKINNIVHKGDITQLEDHIINEYKDLYTEMHKTKPKFVGGKRKIVKKSKKKVIRKHKGINQSTGRLNKGYKYSGKKLKSGLREIIKR